VFMAARFDATRAAALGQRSGDGTPIMVTMKTDEPWVPLRILSLGLKETKVVEADVFLLTDDKPKLLAGGRGLSLDRDEPASPSLLSDLRSDQGMGWVPDSMHFTFLRLAVPAGDLDYDLAVSTKPEAVPSLKAAGVTLAAARRIDVPTDDNGTARWPLFAALLTGVAAFGIGTALNRRTHEPS